MTASNISALVFALDQALTSPLEPEVLALGHRLRHRLGQRPTVAILGHPDDDQPGLSTFLANHPRLAQLNLCEIAIDNTAPTDHLANDLASMTPQLALWFVRSFSCTDRIRWSHVPQSLRDHSFLVLTTDQPQSAELLADHLVDEFRDIFVLPFRQAAQTTESRLTRTIAEAVLHQIALGEEALHDNVRLFLSRYAVSAETKEPSASERIHAALSLSSQDLIPLRDLPTANRAGAILAHCVACIETISPMAAGQTGPLFDDIVAASDSLTLMQAEGGEATARDALSLLLQLRREIATSY